MKPIWNPVTKRLLVALPEPKSLFIFLCKRVSSISLFSGLISVLNACIAWIRSSTLSILECSPSTALSDQIRSLDINIIKMRRQSQSFWSIRGFEKLIYLIGMPSLVSYGGYQIYRKNVAEAEERAQRLKLTEEKFLSNSNIVKLQNFNKKVFAIGVYDDILDDPEFAKT